MNRQDLGNNIKRLRLAAGFSQAKLSEACGWIGDNSRVSNYERGKREPRIDELTRMAEVLGIEIADFYRPTAEESSQGDHSALLVQRLINAFLAAPDDRKSIVLELLKIR